MHKLVEKRKSTIIVRIIQFLNEEFPAKNKYLQGKLGQNEIKAFLASKDNNGVTPAELAAINTFMDIY